MKISFARSALGLFTLGLWMGCGVADEASEPGDVLGEAQQELLIGRRPCLSTSDCRVGHCTTEDGACNRPPGCGPNDICPAVCYGVCALPVTTPCGTATCSAGEFCCNASCNTCAPLGGACTQQFCSSAI
jgi:hypothetical protein